MTVLPEFLQAAAVAVHKHRLQRRQDAEASPYSNHPFAVAAFLAGEGGVTDGLPLVAAVLHDTLEDTETTPAELATVFGPVIRDLVQAVTDDTTLLTAARKTRQAAGAARLTDRATLLRIADQIAHVRDGTHHSPAPWDRTRRRAYLDWTAQVVAGCRGVNPSLDATYDRVLREGRAVLASQPLPTPDV